VKPPTEVTLPPAVVTTTSFAPAVPAGVVTAIEVAVLAPSVAAVPPMVTLVTPERLVPVMVTEVPPPVGPLDGVTLPIVGPVT
jgi:hypothetical protein